MEKACTKCGEVKPLSEYYKNGKNGLHAQCKSCAKAQVLAYQHANREEHRARTRRWRERNPEKNKRALRKWAEENPERRRAYLREWKKKNQERVKELNRRWAEANPEKVRANSWVQGARRRGEKPSEETQEYRVILESDPCAYCGAPMEEKEHIIYRGDWHLSVPGWNEWSNLTASCRWCNRSKGRRSLLTFLLEA